MDEQTKDNQEAVKKTNLFTKILQSLGILKNTGRRPYHVGWLAPGVSVDDLKIYLHGEWGFGKTEKEIKDKDLVLHWRKITENHLEYNIQAYKDGEIRGYYKHLPITGVLEKPSEMGEKEAKADFLRFLGELSVDKKFVSNQTRETKQVDPEPEILHDTPTNELK